jgi:hypothetical protein
MNNLALGWADRQRTSKPLPRSSAPSSTGNSQSATVHVIVSIDRHALCDASGEAAPVPSGDTGDTNDASHGPGHELHPAQQGGLTQSVRHAPAIDACGARVVQGPVHWTQRRKQGDGIGGADLSHSAAGTAHHPVCEGGEPALLAFTKDDGEKAAGGVPRTCRVHTVSLDTPEQLRIVLPCSVCHPPPHVFGSGMCVGRQDPGAGISGATGVTGIDDRDRGAPGRELIGQ